jgi:hypothetical protein
MREGFREYPILNAVDLGCGVYAIPGRRIDPGSIRVFEEVQGGGIEVPCGSWSCTGNPFDGRAGFGTFYVYPSNFGSFVVLGAMAPLSIWIELAAPEQRPAGVPALPVVGGA